MHKAGKTSQPSSINEARKFFAFFGKALFPLRKSVRQSTISSYRKDEFTSVSKWLAKFWHCRFKVFMCFIILTSIESSFTKKKNLSASIQTRPERFKSLVFNLFAISLIILFISLIAYKLSSFTLSSHNFASPDSCQGYISLLIVF